MSRYNQKRIKTRGILKSGVRFLRCEMYPCCRCKYYRGGNPYWLNNRPVQPAFVFFPELITEISQATLFPELTFYP